MNLLQELLILSEASKEKNLLGLKIDGKLITDKTKDEPWPGNFGCYNNQLTSFEGIHKILKSMNGTFYANKNPLKSHVLGLLLVKGCKKVELDNKVVEEVLNRYLPNTRGSKAVIEAQSELLDLDLEEFAQL